VFFGTATSQIAASAPAEVPLLSLSSIPTLTSSNHTMRTERKPPFRRVFKTRRIALVLVLGPASAPVLAALWPADFRPYQVDLISHFIPQAAVACALIALGTALIRVPRATIFSVAPVLLAILLIHLDYRPLARHSHPGDGEPMRVVHFNARNVASSSDHDFVAWLLAQHADLVSLVDAPPSFAATHPSVSERYPYRVEPRRHYQWPIVLLSRYPIRTVNLGPADPDTRTSFVARSSAVVTLPSGQEFLFTSLHPYSPRNADTWARSIEQIKRDASRLRDARSHNSIPVVAAGDFNSSPTGRVFRMFRRISGLRATPITLSATWPANRPRFLGVAIDHVFTSTDIARASRTVGPAFNSDHRPVVIDIVLPLYAGSDPGD
jgi:endonuclease/exonuclease/phosphatase (EEP) superfamily protein YafD